MVAAPPLANIANMASVNVDQASVGVDAAEYFSAMYVKNVAFVLIHRTEILLSVSRHFLRMQTRLACTLCRYQETITVIRLWRLGLKNF